jgi:hypothetical protein
LTRWQAQRRVSSRGGIPVACRRILVGLGHARQIVTIQLAETTVRVIDQNGELITTGPRNGTGEISRVQGLSVHAASQGDATPETALACHQDQQA